MRHKAAMRRVGLPPGTLLEADWDHSANFQIKVIDYDESVLIEKTIDTIEELAEFRNKPTVSWIQVIGSKVNCLKSIGRCFDLHDLVLEDIHNFVHRPKMEDYEDYLFLIIKVIREQQKQILIEQISLVIALNYVISFQENDFDIFEPVRKRVIFGQGRARKFGADYLAYELIDTVVDNYFVVLEQISEQIEGLEDQVLLSPNKLTIRRILNLKTDMQFIRKSIWPLREVMAALERGETEIFQAATLIYIRDVYDHIIQIIDTVETYRDMIAGLFDLSLSSISNKMNEIMKVLTIISTIFIPLTFLAGLEGMNFKHMPELDLEWGYPVLLLIMLAIVIIMVRFFRKHKWI